MSLNPTQMKNTRKELKENFEISGLTKEQVASDLNISLENWITYSPLPNNHFLILGY